MNNSVSLTAILDDEKSILTLVQSLGVATLKTKTYLLELLAAVW